MAGHSKWANIKRRKAVVDAKRGKIFTRISKEITVSARLGGGDINANPRLRLAVQNARAENMAMDTIQRAIQKGTGELEGVNYEEIRYEGYAPGGVAIILEMMTDNRNRSVADLRSFFTKLGGALGETNSVAWNFARKGVVYLHNNGTDEETMLNHVISADADDMTINDDAIVVYSPTDSLAQTAQYFQEQGFVLKEMKFEYIPLTMVSITSPEEAKKIMKLLDALEDYDDTQNLFTNADFDDEMLENLE